MRAIVLHCVVAVASGVDASPVVAWLQEQQLWEDTSPRERSFLLAPKSLDQKTRSNVRWHQEAQWTLLWVISKVESLGLPTRQCDTGRLADEIMPALGSNVEPFLATARLQPPGLLLAEEDRHYNLWCQYFQTRRLGDHFGPRDLEYYVLYERQYAFEWLGGHDPWDQVQCDA